MKKIMSTAASSPSSTSIAYLTGDIWFEICLRLPLDLIFKFRCVSKIWFSILSNPRFINSWLELNELSLPWGFVIFVNSREEARPRDEKFRRMFTIAYPDSHSDFASNCRQNEFSLSFLNRVFPNHIRDGADLHILGSSNGLVLCKTILLKQRRYYVCNPLTRKRVSLPPPLLCNLSSLDMLQLATGFICSNECDSVSYKVICIPKFEAAAEQFKVEIFSSDSGKWNLYHVSRPQYFTWRFSFSDYFVTRNGVFYWMQKWRNNILAFSVDRITNHGTGGNECRLISLPDREIRGVHYLGESQGSICYVKFKHEERSLIVWVLEDYWHLVHKDIKFHVTLTEMVSWLIGRLTTDNLFKLFEDIRVLGLSPIDKNVVILAYKEYIWAYDIRTKGYEQLRHPSLTGGSAFVSHMAGLTFALKLRPTPVPPRS